MSVALDTAHIRADAAVFGGPRTLAGMEKCTTAWSVALGITVIRADAATLVSFHEKALCSQGKIV
jgi:hypothetical protein